MAVIFAPEQPTLSGRIGKGFAQGLAEQVPKEIERSRLSKGLQQLEQDSANLSPMQFLARASAIPGITPQMIQSFGELAKQQNTRSAFQKNAQASQKGGMEPSAVREPSKLNEVKFANLKAGKSPKGPSDYKTPDEYINAEKDIVETSPVREEAIPIPPWSKERRNQEYADLYDAFPNATFQEIQQMAADNEKRELAQPYAAQEQDAYYLKVKNQANDSFDKLWETKTQKKGAETYADLPGEMQVQLRKKMYNDIIQNKIPVDKAADKWTQIGLDQAKQKKIVETLANQNWVDALNKRRTLNNLESAQKVYDEAGNLESFYNQLISKKKSNGFEMSPQGAAWVAYPRSEAVKKEINNYKPVLLGNPAGMDEKARTIALNIGNKITAKDSFLAIAKDLKYRDPFFDEHAFFRQINEMVDDGTIGLTPRQKRELSEGESGVAGTWGDAWVLPSSIFSRKD